LARDLQIIFAVSLVVNNRVMDYGLPVMGSRNFFLCMG